MRDGPLDRYRSLVLKGALSPDTAQELAAEKLQLLANRLSQYTPPGLGARLNPFARKRRATPEGLYLYGDVGRGKTLLLDIFYEVVRFAPKRRVHFQEFMAEAHEAIDEARKNAADPIKAAAEEMAASAALLCFDELEITDIADAMIVGRLFQHLFDRDVVMVATSNSAPAELYKNGLNRQLFLPFIALIEGRMETYELAAAKDYRLEKLHGSDLYFKPADARARAALDAIFLKLTGRERGDEQILRHKGRNLVVPEAALGVARFTFAELCEAPLSALDYQHLAHAFHTILIDGIPVLPAERRNEARRLMLLIDALYDNGVGLVASASAEPNELYKEGLGADGFVRTASRLVEMRSEAYLTERHRRP